MLVLVACEFSGTVREAFRQRGHDAVSCDLTRSERPGPHIRGDVRNVLADGWDLMIAHPPCQYLALSGARWWRDPERQVLQREALEFVRQLLAAPIPMICLENPIGAIGRDIAKASQYVQPWWFGHPVNKKTGLWLKELPELKPTQIVRPTGSYAWRSTRNQQDRARTFPGIARAMAQQWGGI